MNAPRGESIGRSAVRLAACLVVASTLAFPPTLPPGFEDTKVTGYPLMTNLVAFDFDPEGNVWLVEKDGQAWRYAGGVATLIRTLSVDTVGEHGISAIELDPDFAINAHVWIAYTAAEPIVNRLSRFTYDGSDLVAEWTVVQTPPLLHTAHTGGGLGFATDKTLFYSIGDDTQGGPPQDPFDVRGSILHIRRDGTPAADNPFLDGTGGDPRVWAYGARNPYRLTIQPELDNVFVADVGSTLWEELNLPYAGANLGFPQTEGAEPPGVGGVTYPLHAYDHVTPPYAVVGGDFVPAGNFPEDYVGDFIFGDWGQDRLYRMKLDAALQPQSVEEWATGVDRVVHVKFGPDGALYYIARGPAHLRRTSFVGGNQAPIASAIASPASGPAPLSVTLDGSTSLDPDGDTLSFNWVLGDLGTSQSPVANHVYAQGVYEAILTIDDGLGGTDSAPPLRIVSGNVAPTATLIAPAAGTTYSAGQTISYSGTGDDPEQGALPCSQFTWRIMLHHLDHAHPAQGPLQGSCSGQFSVPTVGQPSPDVFYRVHLQVSDSGSPLGVEGALTHSLHEDVMPKLVTISLRTEPVADLGLTLDGQPVTAPLDTQSVINMTRQLGTPGPQLHADGHTYRWLAWSDGGAEAHPISSPSTPTTYTADFGCDVLSEVPMLDLQREPGGAITLTWSPVADDCLTSGATKYRVYAAATSQPTTPPGSWPSDPGWAPVGTAETTTFIYSPAPADSFFLVVAVGSDGNDGPVGHYGF